MKKRGENRKCLICNTQFYIGLAAIKQGKGKYCSPKCYHTARIIKQPLKCKNCNKIYLPQSPYHARKGSKFCSRRCFNMYPKSLVTRRKTSITMRKIKKKLGTSDMLQNKYKGYKWNFIKRSIYKRDGFQCTSCGVVCNKNNISCHHVIPWRICKADMKRNLVTLCKPCHASADYIYRMNHEND